MLWYPHGFSTKLEEPQADPLGALVRRPPEPQLYEPNVLPGRRRNLRPPHHENPQVHFGRTFVWPTVAF